MADADLWTIHTDGAARGNPGPAAFAFVIERDGQPPIEGNGVLADTTNNVAEYTAMIRALERARDLGARRVAVHSDSELMVKQMLGQYRVKHEGLLPLFDEAQKLRKGFDRVEFRHVRREKNERADELCNEALDGPAKKRQPKAARSSTKASTVTLEERVRDDALECLRCVAAAWSRGDPNEPRAELVWEQLWAILEEARVLKKVSK